MKIVLSWTAIIRRLHLAAANSVQQECSPLKLSPLAPPHVFLLLVFLSFSSFFLSSLSCLLSVYPSYSFRFTFIHNVIHSSIRNNKCKQLHICPLVWSGSKTFIFICLEVTWSHFRYCSFISSFRPSLFSPDTSFPRSDSRLQFRIHESSSLHIQLKNVSCGMSFACVCLSLSRRPGRQ